MSQNKKIFLVILLTAVISSCLTYFIASPTPQVSIAPMQQALQVNEKKAQAISQTYTSEMTQLKKQNDSLLKVVQTHRAALMLSDQKVFQLEDKVSQLADKVKKEPDTAKGKVSDLDTLGTEASVLVSQEVKRDSLCEGEVADLNALVKEKDSALSDCQNSYISMRQVADSYMQQQQNAILQIKGLNKQLKRKAVQSRLLSAGLLILTGVAATLYLSHSSQQP
jgi:DNA polymerase II small subunit/DNA polymerase delta subunit B